MSGHIPVLLGEIVSAASVADGEVVVDGTFGGGGYAAALLEAADCTVFAIDRDPEAIARGQALKARFADRLILREGRFGEMDRLAARAVDVVVLDLGVSSFQFDEADRGFSFRFDAPLDMRMGKVGASAADAVNQLSEAGLADVIYRLGEENDSRRIARVIVEARAAAPIETTGRLAEIVERAVGGRKGAKIHPATRTFQALRMLVNDEMGELARALAAAEALLKPGGRLLIVTFHSLEDRMVKSFLTERSASGGGGSRHMPEAPAGPAPSFRLQSRKSIAPSEAEIEANPRARSARLRVGVRTDAPARGAWPVEVEAYLPMSEWGRIAS
jgi:16S rRNA (cytosine1402-N4)-methyltransferase